MNNKMPCNFNEIPFADYFRSPTAEKRKFGEKQSGTNKKQKVEDDADYK